MVLLWWKLTIFCSVFQFFPQSLNSGSLFIFMKRKNFLWYSSNRRKTCKYKIKTHFGKYDYLHHFKALTIDENADATLMCINWIWTYSQQPVREKHWACLSSTIWQDQEVIVPSEEIVWHITPLTQTDNVIGVQIKQTRYDVLISEL